ncbi:MAG: CotH kinase family protein [Saprospiraceae bacterium]
MTPFKNTNFTLLSFFQLTLCFFTYCSLHAQNLFPDYAPIYKDNVVARIDIILPADSLALLLAPGNEEDNYYFHATFFFDNGTIRDTFENCGLQLRGNTSRYSKKKSFQVSLNTYAPGRTWYGIEKLDLNGEHNDPTVSRSKLCWDLLRNIGVPAPRASHVELYINGEYFGLYANDEHIDEEFVKTRFGNNDGNLYKCLWPADLKYLGSNPDAYKLNSGNRRVYELSTNEDKDDYSDLANFIDILNNTPAIDMQCELESVFNINSYLKSMAFDILSGNWDGPLYNKNNFFLYHNPITGLFEYIPYDLDNTFGIDWFNIDWSVRNIYNWCHDTQPRPLYTKILQVEEYKNRLSYYIHRIINEQYKEAVLFPKLDALKNMLAPFISDDVYYTLDYGFDIDDFNKGFSQSLPYTHTPIGIKPFIASRRSSAITQLELNDISPVITEVKVNQSLPSQELIIQAFIEDDQQIENAEVVIQLNGTEPVEILTLADDGQHHDKEAHDGYYGVSFSLPGSCNSISYTINATDIHGNESHYPVCGTKTISVCISSLTLVINELMASNETTTTDENGEYEDWIEIFNYGTEDIYLGDKYLSDKADNPIKWKLPDISIQPGEYIVVWADEDGSQGDLHANFKLSATGEYVGIYDNDASGNALIDGITFDAQQPDISFGRIPNGTGSFQSLQPTPGGINQFSSATTNEKDSFSVSLFPNPTHDFIFIKGDVSKISKHQWVIINTFGQAILLLQGDTKSINISHLPNGIYVLGVKSDHGLRILGKIVKD